MTRKDFVLIAETIRFSDLDVTARATMAREFADSLRRTNARFDTDRFIAAATKPTRTDDILEHRGAYTNA